MALTVSAPQAACNALATYLAGIFSDCKVRSRWPEASAGSQNKVLTVLPVGRTEYDRVDAAPVKLANASGNTATYLWQVFNCRMPLQIDTWSRTDIERDDLTARLEYALNRGVSQLAAAVNPDPVGDGTTLAFNVADGWVGTVDYVFDEAQLMDNEDRIQRVEYRSMVRGDARFVLTASSVSTRILNLILKEKNHEASPAPGSLLYDITQFNATSITRSTGP